MLLFVNMMIDFMDESGRKCMNVHCILDLVVVRRKAIVFALRQNFPEQRREQSTTCMQGKKLNSQGTKHGGSAVKVGTRLSVYDITQFEALALSELAFHVMLTSFPVK
jgi:hypothetical protein